MRFFLQCLIISIIPVCTLANNKSDTVSSIPRTLNSNTEIQHDFIIPLFQNISLGSLNIKMETTTLDDIRSKFGGEINHSRNAGVLVYSICYIKKPNVFWFSSDGEMGGPEHSITAITFGHISEYKTDPQLSNCTVATELFTNVNVDIPTIGNKRKDIEKKFKGLKTDKLKNFTVTSLFPYSEDKEFTTMQSICYRVDKKDFITKILITQITSN